MEKIFDNVTNTAKVETAQKNWQRTREKCMDAALSVLCLTTITIKSCVFCKLWGCSMFHLSMYGRKGYEHKLITFLSIAWEHKFLCTARVHLGYPLTLWRFRQSEIKLRWEYGHTLTVTGVSIWHLACGLLAFLLPSAFSSPLSSHSPGLLSPH